MFRISNTNKINKEDIKSNHIKEIVIFTEQIYGFENFKAHIDYFELGFFLLKKLKISEEFKNYFSKLFSILKSLEILELKDNFSDLSEIDYEDYLNRIKTTKDRIDKILEGKNLAARDINLKFYNIKQIKEKEEVHLLEKDNPVLYIDKPKFLEIYYSKDLITKYEDYLAFVVSDNKYMELFNCFINTLCYLRLSKNCIEYDCPFNENYIHINIVYIFNLIIDSLIYLRNCSSFQSNSDSLYCFDKIKLDNNIEMIIFYLEDTILELGRKKERNDIKCLK